MALELPALHSIYIDSKSQFYYIVSPAKKRADRPHLIISMHIATTTIEAVEPTEALPTDLQDIKRRQNEAHDIGRQVARSPIYYLLSAICYLSSNSFITPKYQLSLFQ